MERKGNNTRRVVSTEALIAAKLVYTGNTHDTIQGIAMKHGIRVNTLRKHVLRKLKRTH